MKEEAKPTKEPKAKEKLAEAILGTVPIASSKCTF